MRSYADKEELRAEILKSYGKYIAEFDSISEDLKDVRREGADRSPSENLAYQIGWTTLLLKWERDEKAGAAVVTPTERFKWNQLGELYQSFSDTYSYLSLHELRRMLDANVSGVCEMLDSLSDKELFEPHQRKWADDATRTAAWPVYKFIHVNTVAPFGTFRTKIRKWKKLGEEAENTAK